MQMCESSTHRRTAFTTPGDSHPCQCSRTSTNSSPGAPTMIGQGCPVSGARAVGAPSLISRTRCGPRPRARRPTGAWPPFSCGCRAPRVVWPESGACLSRPALEGAGGGGMPPCPPRCRANRRARSKPRHSLTPRVRRDTRHRAGRKRRDAEPVVGARSASRAGGMTTQTDRRLGPGAVARGRSSSRRPAIAPSRRGEGGPYRRASGPSSLHRLGQELSGLEGLWAGRGQAAPEGIGAR
jgi:hypothetical protein